MTLRERKRETFSCVLGQKAEGTKTKRVEKKPLSVSLPRPLALKKKFLLMFWGSRRKKGKEEYFSLPFFFFRSSLLTSSTAATFPVENLTAPGLIDMSSTPSPASLSPLFHPRIFLIFSRTSSSLIQSLSSSFLSLLSSPVGLLLVSSTHLYSVPISHSRTRT